MCGPLECVLTLEVVQHHQHQRVATQRPLAGVVDLVVPRPLLHRQDDWLDPEIRWRETDNELVSGWGKVQDQPMANIVGNTPTWRLIYIFFFLKSSARVIIVKVSNSISLVVL